MKIFISHSSQNKKYGNALVELLRNLGVKENEIVFTSNTAYGIPIGQNIFHWLKSQITEKPFVIYLLSEEYYKSIACLNEMGAAWIVENQHAAIFTPDFNLSSKEFQSGALDPREIGFYINDEERILSLIELLSNSFEMTKNTILISQNLKKFISEVDSIISIPSQKSVQLPTVINTKEETTDENQQQLINNKKEEAVPQTFVKVTADNLFDKFVNLIIEKKLKSDELLLLHYIRETGRIRLMIGWQDSIEIRSIKDWEKINDLSNLLSQSYESAINKFKLRGFTETSALTGGNNPKEVKLKDEIANNILNLPLEACIVIEKVVENNFLKQSEDESNENFWKF